MAGTVLVLKDGGLIEGDGYVIDVDWTGGRRLTVDLNPIRL